MKLAKWDQCKRYEFSKWFHIFKQILTLRWSDKLQIYLPSQRNCYYWEKKKIKNKQTVGLRKITLKLTYCFIFFKCENVYTNTKFGPSYTHSESAKGQVQQLECQLTLCNFFLHSEWHDKEPTKRYIFVR